MDTRLQKREHGPSPASGPASMHAMRIAIIAASAADHQHLARLLGEAMPMVVLRQYSRPEDLLRGLSQERFDCLLVDFRLAGRDGLSLLTEIRRNPLWRKLPAFLLSTTNDPKLNERARQHGAAGCLMRAQLGRDQLRRALESVTAPTPARTAPSRPAPSAAPATTPGTDGLTGLRDQQSFEQAMAEQCRERESFALYVFSADRFQTINNRFGRNGGDVVLRELGRRLRQDGPEGVALFRLRGREFAALWPGHHSALAIRRVARDISARFDSPMTIHQGANYMTHCNLGIARAPEDGWQPAELVAAAMQAMQVAEARGKGARFARGDHHPTPQPGQATSLSTNLVR